MLPAGHFINNLQAVVRMGEEVAAGEAVRAAPKMGAKARYATRTSRGRAVARHIYAREAAQSARKSIPLRPMPIHGPPSPRYAASARNGSRIAKAISSHKKGIANGAAIAGGLGLAHQVTKSGNGTDKTGVMQGRGMFTY